MNSIYDAYGAHRQSGSANSAYMGQRIEAGTGWYLLGERPYSPVLRRFLAPDPFSPFEAGDLNRYAYCSGDPINRIDPSGNAWLTWLNRPLGAGTANGIEAGTAIASPTMAATMAAPVLDTISVGAAVAPTGILPSGTQPGSIVFGRVAAGRQETGNVLPAAGKAIDTNEHFVGRQGASDRGKVLKLKWGEVTVDNSPDPSRLTVGAGGKLRLKPRWVERSPQAAPASRVFAADTVITADDLPELFGHLQKKGIKALNLYTGSHGEPQGRNWHLKTGERLDTEGQFFAEDVVGAKRAGKTANISVNVVSMFGMTEQQMVGHLSKEGVHVMACCYGASDSAVMKATGAVQASVFKIGKSYRKAWAQAMSTP